MDKRRAKNTLAAAVAWVLFLAMAMPVLAASAWVALKILGLM